MYEEAQPIRTLNRPVKLISFYLPQFHPIPENDCWWGKGFTEWRNVTKAKPLFDGHRQPRYPADLGYYDLRLVSVLEEQVRMAKDFGLSGFCFYYYRFGSKRLLEEPLDLFLNNENLDIDFCLCWANESWSRRWDGMDEDVLIAQKYSPEDDISCIDDMMRYFASPRYLRKDGRPIVLVYRVSDIPDPIATVARWKERCLSRGEREPYLVYVQSFNILDNPQVFGFDAAVEFPPHPFFLPLMNDSLPPELKSRLLKSNVKMPPEFKGFLAAMPALAAEFMGKQKKDYTLFRSVCVGFDNTARRGNRAFIFDDCSPQLFSDWLECIVSKTMKEKEVSERYCFINAWNEWAEGAYLEPDDEYGYAFLNRIARVLEKNAIL